MRQAGRYLPEYRAIRSQVGDFIGLCTNPRLASEVTLQPIRRFGFDAAILFSDILMLPWALGHGLEFREGEGPALPPLRTEADLAALDLDRLPSAIAPILETVQRVRAGLERGFDRTSLIGFAGGPFTVACYMVEGGGSREFAATRMMIYSKPDLFSRLIERLTKATVSYLASQIDAGVEAVMIFDSWAGVLSPSQFNAHVIKPTQRIVESLARIHPGVPVIGFPRLAGMRIGDYAGKTGVQAVGMDTSMNPEDVTKVVKPGTALQGNLDPMAVVAGGQGLVTECGDILRAMRGHPFVFNLGHGIVPQTPPENVEALVSMVRGG